MPYLNDMQICYYHIASFSFHRGKRWNTLIYWYDDASITSLALILLLTCNWWMTEFNKYNLLWQTWWNFECKRMLKYVSIWDVCMCVLGGCRVALVIRSSVCVCLCACDIEGAGGITLMKNKFQKASITSAQARAPAFAFQCEVQPPLFMTLYTSKPQPASLYLSHPDSLSPLIPIVTTSPGSPETVGVYREKRDSGLWMVWCQQAFDGWQHAASSKPT